MSFYAELRRRNVIRMAGLYLVGAWLVVQVAATLLPVFEAPAWVMKALVALLAIGFPVAVVFAWVFELTPEGLKRDAAVTATASIGPQTARRMDRMLLLVMALALGYFAFDKFVLAPRREASAVVTASGRAVTGAAVAPPAVVDDKSIAVLAFENMSADADNEYFSDGVSEEILNALTKVDGLKVAGRTSSFYFKGKNESLTSIGRILGVAHVLEGSVRKQGEKVRITAQLIRANDGFHLWSETYDGDLKDVFALQERIAQSITGELKVILQGDQKSRLVRTGTANTEAYQLYLRGRFQWNKRTQASLKQAVAFYTRAIEQDPGYALAYSGLAETYALFPGYGIASAKDVMPQAKAAALRALEIDDSLAQAHAALEMYYTYFEWDRAAGESEARRAIELNPNYATAHQWLAIDVLAPTGRFDEAIASAFRAAELDPLSSIASENAAQVLGYARRYDESIVQYQRLLARDPGFALALGNLGWVHGAKGMYPEAIALTRKSLQLESTSYAKGYLGLWLARNGQRAEAVAVLDELKRDARQHYVVPNAFALVHVGLGENQQALDWLEKAVEGHTEYANYLAVLPELDPLRNEPRFKALLKRVNLPSTQVKP